jgi:hypothetical protein
MENVF